MGIKEYKQVKSQQIPGTNNLSIQFVRSLYGYLQDGINVFIPIARRKEHLLTAHQLASVSLLLIDGRKSSELAWLEKTIRKIENLSLEEAAETGSKRDDISKMCSLLLQLEKSL